MKVNNYSTVEEFLSDESFVSFIQTGNEKSWAEWSSLLNEHPEKKEVAEKAAAIIKLLRMKESPVTDQALNVAEMRLRQSINEKKQGKIIPMRRRFLYWSAAAVVVISLAVAMNYIFYSQPKIKEVASNYGEIKKDKLPDGTEIILNANSNITLGKNWKEGSPREVWVKGEVFFHVKKTSHRDKFIVHTNAFDIEVTGTSFNVINEEDKSSVILKEGSVKIHRNGLDDIIMKPGDFVQFANNGLEKKKIVKDDYLAWTQNKLVFDNTNIADVAGMIHDHYGIEVRISGDNIEQKTITGIMPNDNLQVLLDALEATQEFTIKREPHLIIIENKIINQ